MAGREAVVVRGLRKSYRGRVALDGVSFEVEEGEIFALLGPNGAGKTTTVEICEGLRVPDAGEVRVLGLDPWKEGKALRAEMGVMLQEGGVHPALRPIEVLRLYASFYPEAMDPEEAIALVGLEGRALTPYRRLSGGEKQRLSLALALVGRPRLAFLDEPTAGMDPRGRRETWALVRSLRDKGVTVFLTTNSMEEAEALADRVGILHKGRLVALGPPRLLRPRPVRELYFAAPEAISLEEVSLALGSRVEEVRPGEYRVLAEATPELLSALASWAARAGVLLTQVRVGGSSLEEVFFELTSEEEVGGGR